ncbi:hypothetical protein [Amycolatopsis sp. SID8362]|uniref:hypothetical protein n=1 Tax=Amycolatopsis sp. SID8362 TaxID=2690346 RepID=UPI0013683E67|nr:hypothetical protein [Amycolatopsis sp. SID8362]NBH03433.1 hypothetical protein [Amycolatopsis sp. SID8362]NED40133.1 hypothetical protein [Amycolatopsis sp. SID8362]
MITEAAARTPDTTRLIGCDCTVAQFSFAIGPPGMEEKRIGGFLFTQDQAALHRNR